MYNFFLILLILLNMTKIGLHSVVTCDFTVFHKSVLPTLLSWIGSFGLVLYIFQFIPIVGTIFFVLIILVTLYDILNVAFYIRDLG